MRKFEKLDVYKKALGFVTKVYEFSKKLPDDEKYGLISQLKRASASIVLNIAEGSGSGSDAEFGRFLKISIRSGYEVCAILDIIIELKLINCEEIKELKNEVDEINAMLFSLIRKLKKSES